MALKGKQRIKGIVAALMLGGASTVAIVNTQETPVVEQVIRVPEYAGDTWELQNSLHNGLFDGIKPTGNIRDDFGKFLFGQGGGMSKDPKDQITAFHNAWPPQPYKDGYKYHTVHDITWYLFSNSRIAAWVGYVPTSELFYGMPDTIRNGIIDYHINLGSVSKSIPVNLVCAYSLWGGGGYQETVNRFTYKYGSLDKNIDFYGDYFVFWQLLEFRQQIMKERNAKVWPIYGRGWSNGLASFHRVFKSYTTQK